MGILQTRILEWVSVPSSRGSSQPRDRPRASCIAAGSLPAKPPGKPMHHWLSHSVTSDSLRPPRYLFPITLSISRGTSFLLLFPSLPSGPSSQVICYLFCHFLLICATWPGSRRSLANSVWMMLFFSFLGSLEKALLLSATVVPNENI